jgi:hypothetical protein
MSLDTIRELLVDFNIKSKSYGDSSTANNSSANNDGRLHSPIINDYDQPEELLYVMFTRGVSQFYFHGEALHTEYGFATYPG